MLVYLLITLSGYHLQNNSKSKILIWLAFEMGCGWMSFYLGIIFLVLGFKMRPEQRSRALVSDASHCCC